MNKAAAIELFGSVSELAKALGMTRQAIYQWEDELPQATIDRVTGAAIRLGKLPANESGERHAEAA